MSRSTSLSDHPRLRSVALVSAVLATAVALGAWKYSAIRSADAASANQPEPMETVAAAVSVARAHQETATAIGSFAPPSGSHFSDRPQIDSCRRRYGRWREIW